MLALGAQRALIGWELVNSRIVTAKFTTRKKDIRLNIIQCYAPTNDAEVGREEEFYQQLQAVIDGGRAKDMTILMGDFNAKIGSDNTGHEDIMGTHGLGQMSENGERFADLCALNQLVIGRSIFPHPRSHMKIPRPQNREPDRPYLYQSEVQDVKARCEGAERCRRVIRLSPGCDSSEAPA